jgi:hypothetical protein
VPSRTSLSARPVPAAPMSAEDPAGVASSIAATLVAVRPASGRGRAELIRDVVDAYRRLYNSVQRFVRTLSGAAAGPTPVPAAAQSSAGSASLNQLLSLLADQADAATFVRLRELKAAIGEARSADQLRDSIFSDALSNDLVALRKVVTALERLDSVFVGLSVEHALERHGRVAGKIPAPQSGARVARSTGAGVARSREAAANADVDASANATATSTQAPPTARASRSNSIKKAALHPEPALALSAT